MARAAYWVIDLASFAVPTNAEIRQGQRAGGAPALASGSEPFTATSGTGQITEATPVANLTPGAQYRLSWTLYDGVTLTYAPSAPQNYVWTPQQANVVGGMATSELLDIAAFTGARTYFGALASTEARDAAAFVGTMIPSFSEGAFAGVETQIDTFAAAGAVGPPTGRFGDLAALEARDTATFSGARTYFGVMAATESRDVAAFAGTMIPKFITGSMDPEEARDVFAASGTATTGVPISGGLAATEARDAAAFSGARTYFGTLAAAEARDSAAFAGFITKFITGTMAASEARDRAQFDSEPIQIRNFVILRDANIGLNVSPQQQWRDGAPANPDGTLLPTRLGHDNVVNNSTNRRDSLRRQIRLLQAPQNTQALVDIVPGWYSLISVTAGEWVWCISRDNIVDDADNPIGQDDVVV